nr:MAG TPA: hypothetical protein [Caudoviricetes sp.]
MYFVVQPYILITFILFYTIPVEKKKTTLCNIELFFFFATGIL